MCDNCLVKKFPITFPGIKHIHGIGRQIGIEVECEPTLSSQVEMCNWFSGRKKHMLTAGIDNSLRGRYPVEYKSPILHESNFRNWLKGFSRRIDGRVYNRCGLHIHLSTDDYSWYDINLLMRYCHKYESYFTSIVSPSRQLSNSGNNAGLPAGILSEFGTLFHSKSELLKYLYGDPSSLYRRETGEKPLLNRRANESQGP